MGSVYTAIIFGVFQNNKSARGAKADLEARRHTYR
jgi:hypothetical protein